MDKIPGIDSDHSRKPIFLNKLRMVWARHPQFNGNNSILVDDCRYKSLKNNYENCLAIRSYKPKVEVPKVEVPKAPSYLTEHIFSWLQWWLRDPFPIAYARRNPLFDIEDDISRLVPNYFIAMEMYSYGEEPPNTDIWTLYLATQFETQKIMLIQKSLFEYTTLSFANSYSTKIWCYLELILVLVGTTIDIEWLQYWY